MEYTYKPYPAWRYHREKEAVIVNDPVEEAALGEGWESTPAAFYPAEVTEVEPKKKGRKK